MESRSGRPLALALACSSFLHLLAVAWYVHWQDQPRPEIAVPGLTPMSLVLRAKAPVGEPADKPAEKRAGQPDHRDAPASPPPARSQQEEAIQPPPVQPVRPYPLEAVAANALDLNPVPELREEYAVEMASLSIQAPMENSQQTSLQLALNEVAETLPAWTDPGEALQWQSGGVDYEVRVEKRQPASATGLERAVLSVSTEVDGLSLTATVPVKRLAFSHYAQVVDRWDPSVSLSGDSIVGRFHSNSELWVDASRRSRPLVTGPTTVAGRVNLVGPLRSEQVFVSGLETRATPLRLPVDPLPAELLAAADSSTHRIGKDAQLVFEADRGYRWFHIDAPEAVHRVEPTAFPWLVIAEGETELRVEGVVQGSLLVYSPARISVTGNLTYASDPAISPESTDFLGLVSGRNVEIAPPDITGPGDLDIYASVFARRQFRVRHYRRGSGGRLRVMGSLTAGSLSATEPRYTTRLEFDQRLEQQRPAYFPLTNRYVVDGPAPDWTVGMATARR